MKTVLICLILIPFSAFSRIAYVNWQATGLNNGTSWANAYQKLDSALRFGGNLDTVWVADGTYNMQILDAGFGLKDSTKLFGGFNGTETSISQRNWSSFHTILGPAVYNQTTWVSKVIVWFGAAGQPGGSSIATPFHCRLDGFKVAGANYNGFPPRVTAGPCGAIVVASRLPPMGNLYAFAGCTATIANCLITDNTGRMGGGISICGGYGTGEVSIENCRFENNTATITGGAIFSGNSDGFGTVDTFNLAYQTLDKHKVTITGCTFKGNTAPTGGAVTVWDSTTLINRCAFSGNSAATLGGAIYDTLSARVSVYNSLFAGNLAQRGAAHYVAPVTTRPHEPHSHIHNTIATNVNQDAVNPDYAVMLRGATDTMRNCILWGNVYSASGAAVMAPAGTVVQNNLFQAPAIAGSTGSMSFNPVFAAPGLPGAAPFPISAAYDYRLALQSPAIDTGINLNLPAPYDRDLDSAKRVFGSKPDLGCYERSFCSFDGVITASGPTTFCAPGSVTLTASAASSGGASYTHYWNGAMAASNTFTATAGGTYKVISVGSNGCRGTAAITVTAIAPPNPAITRTGNTLSVPAVYASYQWYSGPAPISGATGPSYSPSATGVYSVRVTTAQGACPGTSAAYNLTKLAVAGGSVPAFRIYPNPVSSGLFVEGVHVERVSVYDPEGRLLIGNGAYPASGGLDVSGLAPGLYILKAEAGDRSGFRRFVKQ